MEIVKVIDKTQVNIQNKRSALTLDRTEEAGSDQVLGKEESWVYPLGNRNLQPHFINMPNLGLSRPRLLQFAYKTIEND
ncbi:unnamed protein product [Prunus armeniaca]